MLNSYNWRKLYVKYLQIYFNYYSPLSHVKYIRCVARKNILFLWPSLSVQFGSTDHNDRKVYKFERGHPVVYIKLCNTLCNVNTQHTSKQEFLMYLNCCSLLAWRWPITAETCSQYNLIVIVASYFDVCCVLTVYNILYDRNVVAYLLRLCQCCCKTFYEIRRV